jgi:mandelamide amidase
MDTPGPMARTVADCALVDSVVTGDGDGLENVPLSELRLGVPRPHFWADLEPEMRSAGEDVLALLRGHGVTLVECDVRAVAELSAASVDVALVELIPAVRSFLLDHGLPFEPSRFLDLVRSPDVRALLEPLLTGSPVDRAVYEHAVGVVRPQLRRAYADCFARGRLDAIVFPTTPLAAAPLGEDESVILNDRRVPTFPTFIRNTSPSAFAGLPGISLPMRPTEGGLPQGIELDGLVNSDRRLLGIASAVEAVLNERAGRVSSRP